MRAAGEALHEAACFIAVCGFPENDAVGNNDGIRCENRGGGSALGTDFGECRQRFFPSGTDDVILRRFARQLFLIAFNEGENVCHAHRHHFKIRDADRGEKLPTARAFARKIQSRHESNPVIGVVVQNRPRAVDLLDEHDAGKGVRQRHRG